MRRGMDICIEVLEIVLLPQHPTAWGLALPAFALLMTWLGCLAEGRRPNFCGATIIDPFALPKQTGAYRVAGPASIDWVLVLVS
jgi:hypothetical protein